jgi:hypothetical protein
MENTRITALSFDKIPKFSIRLGEYEQDTFPNEVITSPPINITRDKDSYSIRQLSVSRWEEKWVNDRHYYIPTNPISAMGQDEWQERYDDLSKSHEKLIYWRKKFKSGNDIPAIVFKMTNISQPNSLRISDGRHRFALYRELGLETFYAAIPNEAINAVGDLGLIQP